MTRFFLVLCVCATAAFAQQPQPGRRSDVPDEKKGQAVSVDKILSEKVNETISSGRVASIGESSSERLSPTARIAPGNPPILAFRYFDGQTRHRFGELDLVMDDAGH